MRGNDEVTNVELKDHVLNLNFTSHSYLRLSEVTQETGLDNQFKSLIMVSLSYPTTQNRDLSTPKDPHVRIAPFARRNHYREIVKRLQKLVSRICKKGDFTKNDFRIFVNSSLPEKELALRSGLGFMGKNSLIITKEAGSQVVLGGIALPFILVEEKPALPVQFNCGTCSRCIDACPTSAINDSKLDKSKCLQALATRSFPEELWPLWENRLYGCQICQDVCPHNKTLHNYTTEKGDLGPSISMKTLLQSGENIKELFKGSTLSPGWITAEHLLRNTLIAAGNHSEGFLLKDLIENYESHHNHEIARAAKWTLNKHGLI